MKRSVLIILLILAIILVMLALGFKHRDKIRKRLFLKKPGKDLRSILFVGDSITAGEYCYSYLIKGLLPDKRVDVLAKGGMRTQWMVDNLKKQLQGNRYDRVYIWGGVNDMFSSVSVEKAISNIQQMVDMVNAQGGDAFVITGYDARTFMADDKLKPTSHVPTKEGMIALKNRYIEFQKQLRRSINHATVVPMFDISSSMGSDGIHPNAAAHKIIAQTLLEDIR